MQLPNSGYQGRLHPLYDASGSITTGGTPQLILPQTPSRAFLFIQNNSSGPLFLETGSARATATINAAGQITGVTVTNGGFNFTKPPVVRFSGGGNAGNSAYLGLNQPGGEGPNSTLTQAGVATAIATLTTGVVTSITVTNPGSGYVKAPYVFIYNSDLDPYGCASPFFSATTSGIQLGAAGGNLYVNGTSCFTDSISVYGATTGQAFTCKWMT